MGPNGGGSNWQKAGWPTRCGGGHSTTGERAKGRVRWRGHALRGHPLCPLLSWPAMLGVSAPWVIKRPRPGLDAAASAQQTGLPESSIFTQASLTQSPPGSQPLIRRRRRQLPSSSTARSNGHVMHGYNQPKGGYCSGTPSPSPLLQSSRKCQMQKLIEPSPSNETKSKKRNPLRP